jgi:cyclic beta-1,2-glucan synthetase
LLQSVARVVLLARRGSIANQLALKPVPPVYPAPVRPAHPPMPPPLQYPARSPPPDLEFFNGLGGFDRRRARLRHHARSGATTTPAPWINVIANPGFGFQAGGGRAAATPGPRTAARTSSRPGRTTPVTDPARRGVIYVRDERDLPPLVAPPPSRSATAAPTCRPPRLRLPAASSTRRTASRSTSCNTCRSPIRSRFLAPDPHQSTPARTRRLYGHRLCGLGARPLPGGLGAVHVTTEVDAATGALLARNPWSTAFPGRVAFADLAWSADRPGPADRTANSWASNGGLPGAPPALRSAPCLSRGQNRRRPMTPAQCCAARWWRLAPGREQSRWFSCIGQGGSAGGGARRSSPATAPSDLDAVLAAW